MLRLSFNATRAAASAKLEVDGILSNWPSFAVFLTIVAVYYLFLLSNGTFQLFAPEFLDKAFDNMLVHLLRGEFTVDRKAIGLEVISRDGKTYAYFGVFPALLRLLALPFTDIGQAQLARLSCLAAAVVFVALQLRALLIVHNTLPAGSRMPAFLAVMAAATALSGPQLYVLSSAWIYNEPQLWAAVLAAGFNLTIVRAVFGVGNLRTHDLVLLATFAGLALNTRASIGVALYFGTVLLVAWTAWCRHIPERLTWKLSGRWKLLPAKILALAGDPRVFLPILVLGLLAVAAGIVNFERWGNPFAFTDSQHYEHFQQDPRTAAVMRNYGDFSLGRIWIGALYYLTGIPYFLSRLVPSAAEFLGARYTTIESPPLTGLAANPITVLLAGLGLYRLWWRPDLHASGLGILRLALIGHTPAVLLVLALPFLTLRYRLDFAPFMTLAALVGYRSVSVVGARAAEIWRKRVRIAAVGFCVLGILISHYTLLFYKVSCIGVPIDVRLAVLPFVPFARGSLGLP